VTPVCSFAVFKFLNEKNVIVNNYYVLTIFRWCAWRCIATTNWNRRTKDNDCRFTVATTTNDDSAHL